MLIRLKNFSCLNYAILHSWQDLPEHLPSDLDIVVAPEDLPTLEKALLEADGSRLVNLLQHESTCYYFVLALRDENGVQFFPVDAATDYRRNGRVWFTAEELLKGRRRWKEFWVAAPEVEFKYLLVKKILKGSVPKRAAERLVELVQTLESRAEELAVELLGRSLGEQAIRWIETGAWDEFQCHILALQRALKRQRLRQDPFNALRYWLPEIRRVWQRWRYPTGLFVAVLGPDGSGKSTLIAHLERELKGAFRRTAVLHLIPGMLRRGVDSGPVTDPHGRPPRSLPVSLLKLLYYLLDYNLGYWLKVRPALVKSTLVLFDRYYDDLLVDPRRYRYGGPLWLARWLRRLIPRPDLWLILDVPEKEILRRKQEVSIEEIQRQREAYRCLAGELPNAFLIDSSLPPDEVARQAREIVLDHMHERYLARRRIWFPSGLMEELAWLGKALGVEIVEGLSTHAWLQLPDGRGYFVPLANSRLFRRGMELYHPRGRRARTVHATLKALGHFGAIRNLLPKVSFDFGSSELAECLQEVFGRKALEIAVSLGTPGPHRKPVLQVMDKSGKVLGYVKVGWNEATKALVQHETRVLQFLGDLDMTFHIPEVLYAGEWGRRWICVQSPLPPGAEPAPRRLDERYMHALNRLAEQGIQRRFLDESEFWERIRARSQKSTNGYWAHVLRQSMRKVLERWRDRQLPFHLAHGDFAPWNAACMDGRLYLYDWEYACQEAPAGYDLFHFLVQTLWLVEKQKPRHIVHSVLEPVRAPDLEDYWEKLKVPKEWIPGLFGLYLLERLSFYSSAEPWSLQKLRTLTALLFVLQGVA